LTKKRWILDGIHLVCKLEESLPDNLRRGSVDGKEGIKTIHRNYIERFNLSLKALF